MTFLAVRKDTAKSGDGVSQIWPCSDLGALGCRAGGGTWVELLPVGLLP